MPAKKKTGLSNRHCGNNPFWLDPLTGKTTEKQESDRQIYWDSQLEFRTYMGLCKQFGSHNVERHPKLPVSPASNHYPADTWKCDFKVVTSDGSIIYVESKGEWLIHDKGALSDFRRMMHQIDLNYPELFQRLFLVSDKEFNIDKIVKTITLDQLPTLYLLRKTTW